MILFIQLSWLSQDHSHESQTFSHAYRHTHTFECVTTNIRALLHKIPAEGIPSCPVLWKKKTPFFCRTWSVMILRAAVCTVVFSDICLSDKNCCFTEVQYSQILSYWHNHSGIQKRVFCKNVLQHFLPSENHIQLETVTASEREHLHLSRLVNLLLYLLVMMLRASDLEQISTLSGAMWSLF